MAKAFKKMFAISIMAVLCVLTLCAPVALADSDKSQTHLFFEGEGDKAPFNKQDITVTIGDKDYNFNSSGSAKHAASTASESEPVVIRDEDVPLAEAPETGDISAVWALMSFVSVGGLVLMSSKRK